MRLRSEGWAKHLDEAVSCRGPPPWRRGDETHPEQVLPIFQPAEYVIAGSASSTVTVAASAKSANTTSQATSPTLRIRGIIQPKYHQFQPPQKGGLKRRKQLVKHYCWGKGGPVLCGGANVSSFKTSIPA
jgi:hypothetical protein